MTIDWEDVIERLENRIVDVKRQRNALDGQLILLVDLIEDAEKRWDEVRLKSCNNCHWGKYPIHGCCITCMFNQSKPHYANGVYPNPDNNWQKKRNS